FGDAGRRPFGFAARAFCGAFDLVADNLAAEIALAGAVFDREADGFAARLAVDFGAAADVLVLLDECRFVTRAACDLDAPCAAHFRGHDPHVSGAAFG